MEDKNRLVDFSYLDELANGKKEFLQQVITIFMDNTPQGLKELETLVTEHGNFESIQKKVHFLKSAFGIVKVDMLYERLKQMEHLAREQRERETIEQLMAEVVTIFKEAKEIIQKKMEQLQLAPS